MNDNEKNKGIPSQEPDGLTPSGQNTEPTIPDDQHISEHTSTSAALGDEQRVKMLSPSMLVLKRFIRNKLAICGLIIIIAMFAFSFLGGLIHPFSETEIFYKKSAESSRYASATFNDNYYYDAAEGKTFNSLALSKFIFAHNNNQSSFEAVINGDTVTFGIQPITDEVSYLIYEGKPEYKALVLGNSVTFTAINGAEVSQGLSDAFSAAVKAGQEVFEYNGESFTYSRVRMEYTISSFDDAVILSKNIYDMYDPSYSVNFDFKLAAEEAIAAGETDFTVGSESYSITTDTLTGIHTITSVATGKPFCNVNNLIVTPYSPEIFLPVDFKAAVAEAIDTGAAEFSAKNSGGESLDLTLERKDLEYVVRTNLVIDLIDSYAAPSATHWLGTDGSGMDILVRLMYGGRVSLTIGFVVVIIEVLIGIVIGGISGYFGKWVDTMLMRLVEIMNCIPTMPLYIILGTALSAMKVDPTVRLYLLMIVLGLTGWPGIARVVRGQILSLREQEFMTATEATGLSVSRRIFKHLVPNVIPQLIVYATMGLGSVIITEATLSFLGLGVKYPYASWGNIVNAVNDSFVLENYWFVWIPAGMLILITVLGFNFVGDGLRDAFDPKMKR